MATTLTGVAGALALEKPKAESAAVLWDLKHLSKAPGFSWYDKKSPVRSLHYQAEPFQGKTTEVFAYYATPGSLAGDPSKDRDLPGIVLLHGGGGRAFADWAKLWASRGYAAIAMSLVGSGADMKNRHGRPWQNDVFSVKQAPKQQWVYHAVSDAILAHSLIRSFPEVDKNRTAITGYSWGGYLTCIAASVDNRFAAAVPVYGCGFLHENSVFKGKFPKDEAERRRAVKLWDPSSYMAMGTVPMLMCDGGADFAYPPDSHAKTYALIRAEKNLHFVPFLRHGHCFTKPHAAELFIESKLNKGKPLARIAKPRVSKGTISAEVSAETKLVSAGLHYCLEALPGNNRKRKYVTIDAHITDKVINVKAPPAEATFWFLTVTDERKATTSSELVFVNGGKSPKHTGGGLAKIMKGDAMAKSSLKSSKAENKKSKLPRVLNIGDSITRGYTPLVVTILKDEAEVTCAGTGTTGHGLENIDKLLGDGKWDVIHFNWGLHDLCYRHPEAKHYGHRDKVNGTIGTTLDQYEKNLDELVVKLKKTGAKLIWATTTVVPEGEAGRFVGDEIKYNRVAAKVMKKHGIVTNDLHALTSGFDKDLFVLPGDVHYKPGGSQKIAEQVAAAIRTAIQTQSAPQ